MVTWIAMSLAMRVTRVLTALGLAYLACGLAWVNRLAWTASGQGERYWDYYGFLSFALGAALVLWSPRIHLRSSIGRQFALGAGCGYLASLVAMLVIAMPGLASGGPGFEDRAIPLLSECTFELLGVALASLLTCGWIFGGLTVIFLEALDKRLKPVVAILLATAVLVCLASEVVKHDAKGRSFAHVQFSHRPTGF
jgi:hypothetical protein